MLFKTKHIVFTTDFSSFYIYENESDEQKIKISNADRPIHILFNISKSQCIFTNETDCNFSFPMSTYIYGEIKSKEFSIICQSKQKIKIIDILFYPQFFMGDKTISCKESYDLLNEMKIDIFSETASLTSTFMRLIIQQIIEFHRQNYCNCFQLENIFYTGKVIEILECVSERIIEKKSALPSAKFVHNIGQAKEILESDLVNPPSLEVLAERVGMSLPHFKRIFKRLTGITAYGFLKQKRMEVALALLMNDSQTISQIADQVGYSSKSHFTKAFVEHFGVRPSSFRGTTCSELPD